jgi:hypothetical protein
LNCDPTTITAVELSALENGIVEHLVLRATEGRATVAIGHEVDGRLYYEYAYAGQDVWGFEGSRRGAGLLAIAGAGILLLLSAFLVIVALSRPRSSPQLGTLDRRAGAA